jgi:TolA-binding protein
VFTHRAAQAETLQAAARLERAAQLYEQTLAVFPGADDEPTTWLYLGEARYELGRHAAAADAYAAAAAHAGADSALAHTAAGQELAALDAAAKSRPAVLERYEAAARRFGDRYAGDGRGLDALERVGELSFAGRDLERAERAYGEVARRTPSPRRAATALKMTGDVAWADERFEVAAARYDSALSRARRGRADSLASTLQRLVPAAHYKAAEGLEGDGDRDRAAARYETLAARHHDFEFADRALYRAAGLRAAAGDTSAAAADYARLVDGWPASELQADALLELGRCHESQRRPLEAARTLRRFAVAHPQHAQAMPARLRAGLLFERARSGAEADSEYARVLAAQASRPAGGRDEPLVADLWMRRARLARTPTAAAPHFRRALQSPGLGRGERAEALFQLTEGERPAFRAIELRQPVQESLRRKQAALEPLLAGYGRCAEAQAEPWHAAACLRIGEALAEFGAALRRSEPPSELEGEDLFAYQEALGNQARGLEDRAVQAWSRGLAAAGSAGHADSWTEAIQAHLYPLLAQRLQTRPAPRFVLVEP